MTAAVLALTAAVLMHVAWNLLARASYPDSRFLFAFGEREHWGTRLGAILLITGGLVVLGFSV